MLIGDLGVGKIVIVEGLVINIVLGNVLEILKNKILYFLEMGLLLVGVKYRGEFEERIKEVVDEVVKNGNIILFIDEMYIIIGVGFIGEGFIDVLNILKLVLVRGEI